LGITFSDSPNKNNKYGNKRFYTLSDCVKYHMKEKGLKQSDIVNSSGLTKATVSRICRNSNDKGEEYTTKDLALLIPLAIALGLTPEEKEELFVAAVPELEFLDMFLEKKYTLKKCNDSMHDYGYSPTGGITQ